MARGLGSDTAPLLARVKKERNQRTGKLLKYAKRFYNFGTSVLKMALYRNLAKDDPLAQGFVAFPRRLDDEYFRQLTAERRNAGEAARLRGLSLDQGRDAGQRRPRHDAAGRGRRVFRQRRCRSQARRRHPHLR
jgi:phage terminase large subunit GpA-like protein